MPLRPLGSRVLIVPDVPDATTASGIVLPSDRDYVPSSGTIAAVGTGSAAAQQVRLATIRRCASIVSELEELHPDAAPFALAVREEFTRYQQIAEQLPQEMAVGDRVVFPVESGLKLVEDGTDYLVLRADDCAVIAEAA